MIYKKINYIRIPFQSLSSGTTLFSKSNSPINTYGDEIMAYTYTPLSDNSKIIITPVINASSSLSFNWLSSAVFFDSETASRGNMLSHNSFGGENTPISYKARVYNSSKTPINIKVRAGGNTFGGTITYNKFFAGDTASSLLIEEFLILSWNYGWIQTNKLWPRII